MRGFNPGDCVPRHPTGLEQVRVEAIRTSRARSSVEAKGCRVPERRGCGCCARRTSQVERANLWRIAGEPVLA